MPLEIRLIKRQKNKSEIYKEVYKNPCGESESVLLLGNRTWKSKAGALRVH